MILQFRVCVKTYFDQILALSFLLSFLTQFLFLPIFSNPLATFTVSVCIYETYYTEFRLPT